MRVLAKENPEKVIYGTPVNKVLINVFRLIKNIRKIVK
jgi:hypothetical protein